MPSFSEVNVEGVVNDGIGTIQINNPDKLNAMSVDMWLSLLQILDGWKNCDGVQVVVLRGAGDKAFCSGADISQFDELRGSADAQAEYARSTQPARSQLRSFPKPVVAQISGYCLGGGLAMAMSADVRISAESGVFGIPAAKLGIAYDLDATLDLVSLVGRANASMMLHTGTRFRASEVLSMGLINEIVPDGDISMRVNQVAQQIACNAPLSLRYHKIAIRTAANFAVTPDTELINEMSRRCFSSEDYVEGRAAFKEKRAPKFLGK